MPDEVTRLLTAYLRGSALRPVAELHTLAPRRARDRQGRRAAEVVHDSVQVLEGNRIVREFDEVEIEQLRDGSGRLIARLERQLRAAGAKRSDGRPEGVPGSRPARAGTNPGQARCARGRASSAPYLQTQVDALVQSDPLTRRGEVEGVHGMRVATRRMRSALKEARRQLEPSWVEETRSELKWLGSLLGDVRDADVFAAYVRARGCAARRAEPRRAAAISSVSSPSGSQPARARLAEALDSPRYVALLDRLEATRESLPVTPSRESTERMLRRAARRTRRRLRGVSRSSSDTRLHELRIASKRARYAGELAAAAAGPRRAPAGKASGSPADDPGRASGRGRGRAAPASALRATRRRPQRSWQAASLSASAHRREAARAAVARRGEALRRGRGPSLAVHRIVTGS